ncbi:unnamed protein product [Enterobius vermicularis]|uniref:Fatty-acid and retinol-binding protein 1 n=1 Tax=Enterobius vermicularis TaxID=51028 RepID=A0A0N4V8U7_ENTVE|nr:unnamed protein product [Enterobius vermicularis]
MLGKLLVFSLLIAVINAHAIPMNIAQIPKEIRDLIPQELKDFFGDLKEEDKRLLKNISRDFASFPHEDQALEELKRRSPKLWEKIIKIRESVMNKIGSLTPGAKIFIQESFNKLKELRPPEGQGPNPAKIRETVKTIIKDYNLLSAEAKQDLQKKFPQVTKLLKNEKFRALAKSFLEKQD